MTKTVFITGATDGIGLQTTHALLQQGHNLIVHGRSAAKLDALAASLRDQYGDQLRGAYRADLSDLDETKAMLADMVGDEVALDVLINNAGVYKTADAATPSGIDIRFVVNTIAPLLITEALLPAIPADGRIVNLSSAAQAPVHLALLKGEGVLHDQFQLYAQSKLAITMWTRAMAATHPDGPLFVAVNPGSLLATNMVREGFNVAGHDINIGVDILCRAALSEEFEGRSGEYFDNDARRFSPPHPAGTDAQGCVELLEQVRGLY